MTGGDRERTTLTAPGRRRSPSIAQKLPLIAGALILLVGASVSLASYFEVRHTARVGAEQRISDLLDLLTNSQRTGTQLINTTRFVAARPAIGAFLDSTDNQHRVAAVSAMLQRLSRNSPTVFAVELRSADGGVLLSTNPEVDRTTDFPPAIAPGDSGSVGKLRMIGDSIVYPVSARVPGGSGAYLVEWRHNIRPGASAVQTRELIGTDVTFLIGNTDGSYWNDGVHLVKAPPGDLRREQRPYDYIRVPKQGEVISGIAPLNGTPWALDVEFPIKGVLKPANQYLRIIMLVTLVCVGVGLIAAWFLARRITVPLQQLTIAADTIAAGGHADNVLVARRDELGRLATSFDIMAQQIRESRQRLEDTVAGRTRELHSTLEKLQDAQEALVRREKLALLGQLAGGVGHELRNPLGVMSNAIYYLDLVLQDAPVDVRDYLRLLREQVTLSSKIVGDLLDMARLTPPQRRVVTASSIIDAQLARLTPPPGITVCDETGDTLPPVEVDPIQIGQVVFNLLTNAVQAMNEQGTLRIAATTESDMLHLTIGDTGPGISPEHLEKIFEPLFTTKARGIGLGLAVSRALAQSNGGDIGVDSEPGVGATFTLMLPIAAAVPA